MIDDFATLFAHIWYRDFPLQRTFREQAQRADWTIHIGIAVRATADLMCLFTHFESGGRTDAVLRDNQSKALAVLEWEWEAIHNDIPEFDKLKDRCAEQGERIKHHKPLESKHLPNRPVVGSIGANDINQRSYGVTCVRPALGRSRIKVAARGEATCRVSVTFAAILVAPSREMGAGRPPCWPGKVSLERGRRH